MRQREPMRGLRWLTILVVLVLPLLYLIKLAWIQSDVDFLPPSCQAEWSGHPFRQIVHRPREGRKAARDVEFARDFSLAVIPERLELRLRAFTHATVRLNGVEILPDRAPGNWKRSLSFDLTPNLRTAENRLRIRVTNRGAIPTLLVESPDFLRTPDSWLVALEPNFASRIPAVGAHHQPERPGPLQLWTGWRWARWLSWGWIGGIALLAAWTTMRRFRGRVVPRIPARVPAWARKVVPAALLLFSSSLYLNNAFVLPPDSDTFDWEGHAEYVQHVARQWTPPLATDGWQMYQPPLYYYAAAVVHRASGGSWKAVQVQGCVMALALALVAWFQARWLFPGDAPSQWIALGFAAFLPMNVYMSPLIGNEVFAGTVIALALYLLLRSARQEKLSVSAASFLGLLTGLALLSRFTALFTFVAGCLLLGLRALRRRTPGDWRALGAFVAATGLICGWFYARNVLVFGEPLIGNWDEASGFHYEQLPSFRTADFYVRFGSVFFNDLEHAHWNSWLDGMYASSWADSHGVFHRAEDDQARFWMGVMLILAAYPTMIVFLGLGAMLLSALKRPALNPDLGMIAVSFWTWSALVGFTMLVPVYSTIKAFFFLSLTPVLGACLARGRRLLGPAPRSVLDVTLVLLLALAIYVYRYQGSP